MKTTMNRRSIWLIGICFALSGATGLVAEIVWSRSLQEIFGSTAYSITTVVATYMLGLGAGSLIFGRVADRTARPERLYAGLELAAAAGILASPLALAAVKRAFVAVHGVIGPSPTLGAVVKAVLASAVLSIPTLCMGGTLPALARYAVGRGGETVRWIGSLYALNTLGAVAGTLLGGFFLIERWGLRRPLFAAAAIDAGIAVLVWLFAPPGPSPAIDARDAGGPGATGTASKGVKGANLQSAATKVAGAEAAVPAAGTTPKGGKGANISRAATTGTVTDGASQAPPADSASVPDSRTAAAAIAAPPGARTRVDRVLTAAAIAAGVSGFVALLSEVAWSRVLALVIGSSTYAFTVVLACFLLGIVLGSTGAARWGAGPAPLARFAAAQAFTGLGVLSLAFLFSPLSLLVLRTSLDPLAGWPELISVKSLVAALAVLPATIGMGATFPLLLGLAANTGERPERELGRRVGFLYASNTLGSILGAVAAGFVLLVRLGSFRTLEIGAFLSFAMGAVALVLAARAGSDPLAGSKSALRRMGSSGSRDSLLRAHALPATLLVLLAVALVAARPWPPHVLDRGYAVYGRDEIRTTADYESFVAGAAGTVLFLREGLSSTVTVGDLGYTRHLRINGKTDAGTGRDMPTQVSLGLYPALARPGATRALVIGAGSGVTARVLAAVPDMARLDVVEIEPAVIEAGRWFEAVNDGVYRDPRVKVVLEDGRNHLLTTDARYDIVSSEPSNVWMPGVAALFSREFYALVRDHLAPGGVFCQWIQGYDLTPATLRRVSATLLASFPNVEMWRTGRSDFFFLCSTGSIRFDLDWMRRVLSAASEPRPLELETLLQISHPEDALAAYVLGTESLREFAGEARPYSDDPPELEFQALRDLGSDPRVAGVIAAAIVDVKKARADLAPSGAPWVSAPAGKYLAGRLLLSWGYGGIL